MSESMPDPVVVRFPTIMDGAVLRWYPSVEAAESGRELCSASRNGVWEEANDTCPLEWLNDAHKVHDLLRQRGSDADTSPWETHRKPLFGTLGVRLIGQQNGIDRLTKVWLDERAKCPTCEGTKRLYTFSQDDEGFPCPMCQRFDGPHCTCGLSDGHPEYAHTTSCPLSSRRYTEQTTNHAPWCIGRPDHEGKCLDRLVDKAQGRNSEVGNGDE